MFKVKILFVFLLIVTFSDLKANSFPDFTLPKMDGTGSVSFSTQKGKVALIDFWASWCAPCRVSFPLYNDLYKKYSPQNFEIIAISTDTDLSKAKDFVSDFSPDFMVLSRGRDLARNLDLPSMPTSYILDKEGNIVYMHRGFNLGDEKLLEEKIQRALKK